MPKPSEDFLKLSPTLNEKGYVKNEDVRQILNISRAQATRLLHNWVASGFLHYMGKGRGAQYIRK